MSSRKRKPSPPKRRARPVPFAERHAQAANAALAADPTEARRMYEELLAQAPDNVWRSQIESDLAVLAANAGNVAEARARLRRALELDPKSESASENLKLLGPEEPPESAVAAAEPTDFQDQVASPIKVAVVSFLFNWPSTGGGIVHTLELARELGKAGYAVRHIYARNERWGVGRVEGSLPYDALALDMGESDWNSESIQLRYRQAVQDFDPDYVIITDSWNMKPVLAGAVREYPFVLRLQASECLCPLNNLRFLPDGTQCGLHQLATPLACRECVATNAQYSGALHQMERDLAGVGTSAYEACLREAFQQAEAVLVVNELTASMVSPHARRTIVAPSGFDSARFAPPDFSARARASADRKPRILMAGLVDDPTKGYHVLHAACGKLWTRRQDFELLATADPPGRRDDFTRWVGWQTQSELPDVIRDTDILVVPTIAQDALGRTAVEGMAAGVPVVASRIGGLPLTLSDGAGLLFTPGDADDLAETLALLLDDPALRLQVGRLGRRRFERAFTWEAIIERHYRPLLASKRGATRVPPPMPESMRVPPRDAPFRPFIPLRVNTSAILRAAAAFLGLRIVDTDRACHAYRMFHELQGYEQTLGELKTLCFEEACVLYLLLLRHRPRKIVEIGTQYGKSARRILDMVRQLGMSAELICFDEVDEVRHFQPHEARLVVRDVRGAYQQHVLDALEPDLVFVDVHGYHVLREILEATMAAPRGPMLAIHDCGRGLCNPRMAISKDDPGVTSCTGIWERYVLAEAFGIADPMSVELDEVATKSHRLRILDTPHGLGLVLPRSAEGAQAALAEMAPAGVAEAGATT